jgi:hypothetical protein
MKIIMIIQIKEFQKEKTENVKILLPEQALVKCLKEETDAVEHVVDLKLIHDQDVILVQYKDHDCEITGKKLKNALSNKPTDNLTAEYLPTYVYYWAEQFA